jgi:hypothetical protein
LIGVIITPGKSVGKGFEVTDGGCVGKTVVLEATGALLIAVNPGAAVALVTSVGAGALVFWALCKAAITATMIATITPSVVGFRLRFARFVINDTPYQNIFDNLGYIS